MMALESGPMYILLLPSASFHHAYNETTNGSEKTISVDRLVQT